MDFNVQNKLLLLTFESEEDALSRFKDHFIILFVTEGTGTLLVEKDNYKYSEDSVFLIQPTQTCHFVTTGHTRVFGVVFGKSLTPESKPSRPINGFANLFRHIQHIFFNMPFMQGRKIESESDRNAARQLIGLMTHEMLRNQAYSREIIKNAIFLLANLLSRNAAIENAMEPDNVCHQQTDRILETIKEQICQNKKVDIQGIESRFDLASGTINDRIVARTGLTFKKFIVKSRMDLFRSRLLRVDMEM